MLNILNFSESSHVLIVTTLKQIKAKTAGLTTGDKFKI